MTFFVCFCFFLFCYYFVNKGAEKEGNALHPKNIWAFFFFSFSFVFLSKIFWCHCFIYCPSNNLFCRFVFFLGKRSKDKSCFFFNWVKPNLIKSNWHFYRCDLVLKLIGRFLLLPASSEWTSRLRCGSGQSMRYI